MAIAHVCVHCGWDLARVRAAREPRYGLNMVRCPKCGSPSVRRRHPIHGAWRQFRRIDFALTLLCVRFVGIVILTLFCVVGSVFALVLLTEPKPMGDHTKNDAMVFSIFFFIGIPIILGTFLSAAFAHAAKWKVWLSWQAWMGLVLLIVSVHGPMDSQFDPRAGLLERGDPAMHVLVGIKHIFMPTWLASGLMLIMALPGIVGGRLILQLRDTILRARNAWRHRRLKLARSANI